MQSEATRRGWHNYRRLLRYVRPYRGVFAVAIVTMVALAATEPLLPALLEPLLDKEFLGSASTAPSLKIPLALVALFALRGVLSFVSVVSLQSVGNRVVMDLRADMFARLTSLPAAFFDQSESGTLISRFTFDATQVSEAVTHVLEVAVKDSCVILALLAYMLYLEWRLAIFIMALAPAIAWIIYRISARLRESSRLLQGSIGELNQVASEAIEGNREMKVFAGEAYERERFFAAINSARKFQMKVIRTAAANVPLIQLLIACGIGSMIYFGLSRASAGGMTPGQFTAFVTAVVLLLAPTKRLVRINEHLQRGLAAAATCFELLDEPAEASGGGRALDRATGELDFEAVTFRYRGAAQPALDGITLHIAAGETVALVGASGGGKTTLASLVAGFYAPQGGRILLDGFDIAELDMAALRRQIALVSQRVVLFNDSLRNNIAYGAMRGIDAGAVERAAALAHVNEFADVLPEGLDTMIGESGARLSGGQRQRVAIARALLKDAPILILDEATSALDSATERLIQDALGTVMRGRTALIIAHRLSTIEHADRIVLLDGGRIVEQGTHLELLARGGRYAQLQHQQGGNGGNAAAETA